MPNDMHSLDSNASSVPAFLMKLWKLVDEPTCDELIAWSDMGNSFIIKDQPRFAKELLPQYFKHNNMASFIRQLNMYGFKKVINYERSGLRNESTEIQFQHRFFIKDRSDLLDYIKRKISNAKVPEPPTTKSNPKDILVDLTSIREKQENMDGMLLKMKKENELLWRELTSMRQKHKAQEQIIQRVIQFLVTIVQRSGNQNIGVNVQRKIARMLHGSPTAKPSSSTQVSTAIDVLRNNNTNNTECLMVPNEVVSPLGPVIHEVTDIDHEEVHSPSTSILPSVQSPASVSSVKSPRAVQKGLESKQQRKPFTYSILKSPGHLAVPIEPLSILENLQPKTPSVNAGDDPDSILGLPLDYISASTDNTNTISIPETNDSLSNSDVLPIEDLGSIISIPGEMETSTAVPSVLSGNEFYTTPNLEPFSPSQPSPCGSDSPSTCSSPLNHNYDDPFGESLHTPQICDAIVSAEDVFTLPKSKYTNAGKTGSKGKSQKVSPNADRTHQEHNYQLATTDPSALMKNILSNHLLSVDERLNYTRDSLQQSNSSLDLQLLLSLFNSEEGICNDTFSNNLHEDISIKTEPTDIIGNEVVQFTGNTLDLDMVDPNLFNTLVAPSEDFQYPDTILLDDVLRETPVEGPPDILLSEEIIANDNLSIQNSKSRIKRRKLK